MHDLLIIGGGPGGYLAAERAGHHGLDVVLFEMNALGGVCLNEGCIPSKTLLNSAKHYDHAVNSAAYGVHTEGASIDQAAVIKRKKKVVRTLVAGVKQQMKANHVQVVSARAVIEGQTKDGIKVKAGDETYEGKALIIATGSSAIVPPIDGVREGIQAGVVMTNREILDLETIPKTMTIVGGGVIGLEMASYFQTVGTAVTVIEMLDHIAGATDREVSDMLKKHLEKKGITFCLGCKVTKITPGAVHYEHDGVTESVDAERVLLSIGRRPNVTDIGLETLGVTLERGAIVTDEHGRTNVPNVYAIGDVNGHHMLAHAAYREAEVAVNTLLGQSDTMRYNALPSVIYTHPEVASVGLSEEELIARHVDYVKQTTPMAYAGRFVAENERGEGLCKLLVDRASKRLLGVHLLGSYVSEFVLAPGVMIEANMTVDAIKKVIVAHPTVSEVIREAIFQLDLA